MNLLAEDFDLLGFRRGGLSERRSHKRESQ
jgi:hypothetical protein